MSTKLAVDRMMEPATLQRAVQFLPKFTGVIPQAGSVGAVANNAGISMRAESVWWPASYQQAGVNALASAAFLGRVLAGVSRQADTLTLAADANASVDSTVVPPLESNRWPEPMFPGKPRVAGGQPVLVVNGVKFGSTLANIGLNVGEPLVAQSWFDPATGNPDYSRHVYDVITRGPLKGSLDTVRHAGLDTVMLAKKAVRSDPSVALNLTPGGALGNLGCGFGYLVGMARTGLRRSLAGTYGAQGLTTAEQAALLALTSSGQVGTIDGTLPAAAAGPTLPAPAYGRAEFTDDTMRMCAYLSWTHGGFVLPGYARDLHRLGVNDDNEAVNPATLFTGALWGNGQDGFEALHAPLDFEQTFEPVVQPDFGVPYRVHLQVDPRTNHEFHDGFLIDPNGSGRQTRDGRWRWHVRIPLEQRANGQLGGGGTLAGKPTIPPTIAPPFGPGGGGGGGGGQGGIEFGYALLAGSPGPLTTAIEAARVPVTGALTVLSKLTTAPSAAFPLERPAYTYEPVTNGAARLVPGTADGLTVFHPPEIGRAELVTGASIEADKRVSAPTLLLHKATLAFGAVKSDYSAAVDAWRMTFNTSTKTLDASYYDSTGTLDGTKAFTVNGASLATLPINLATGVTGDLPFANFVQAGSAGFVGATGAGDYAHRTPTQVTAALDAFTGDSGAGGVKGLVPAPAAGDAAANKFLKANGSWAATAGGGDFVGPGSSTDNAVVRFDTTTGKLGQNSVVIIGDTGATSGITSLAIGGALSGATTGAFSGTISATSTGTSLAASGDITIAAGKRLYLDGGGNTYIEQNSADVIHYVAGSITGLVQTTSELTIGGPDPFDLVCDYDVDIGGDLNVDGAAAVGTSIAGPRLPLAVDVTGGDYNMTNAQSGAIVNVVGPGEINLPTSPVDGWWATFIVITLPSGGVNLDSDTIGIGFDVGGGAVSQNAISIQSPNQSITITYCDSASKYYVIGYTGWAGT